MLPYTLNEDELLEAQRAHLLRGLRRPRRVVVLAAIVSVAVAATTVGDGRRGFYEALAFLAFFSVAFPIAFFRFVLRAHARKLLATVPNFQGPQHVTVSDDGITARNAVGAWNQRWTAFRGYRLLATTVSLYTSDQSFYVVPRAALEPGELELITSHLPDILING